MVIMNSKLKLTFMTKRVPILLALGLALIGSGLLSQLEAQNIEVEAMCGGRLSITWKPPPGAGGYHFFDAGEGAGSVTCSEEENKCVIEGLKPGQEFAYYLDQDGEQATSTTRFRGPSIDCPEYIEVTPTPRPPADTCAHLPAEISVKGFQPFSTQCRRVGAASVGNASLMAQGILDAVDIWGNVGGEVQVCFQRQGRLYFLDASTSPRLVSDLPAERFNGMTCGRINRAGTVAILPGGAPASEPASEPAVVASESESAPEQTGPTSTTSCQLVTSGYLSLRAGPSVHYARILSMPRGRRLVARARIDNWFMVNYQGQLGWAHGQYLAASPGCDGLGEAGAIILPPMVETPAPQPEEAIRDSEVAAPESEATEMVEQADEAQVGCQVTTVDIVNLRAGPGLEYEVYAEIPYESVLSAMAITRNWFQVVYEGITGWISRQYVFRWGNCDVPSEAGAIPRDEPPAPQTEARETSTESSQADVMADIAGRPLSYCDLRTGDIINLRQGPGLEYSVLAEIPYRTNLSARERSGDWFKVDYQSDIGWVHIDYVFRNGACG